jgi:hypothetical protein
MSFKKDYDYEEEEEDDDEGDFVPGIEDEDIDDDNFSDEDSPGFIPPFVQGHFTFNDANPGTIFYKQNGFFCLKSQEKLPSIWSLHSPSLQEPIKFGGWIGNPAEWLDFNVRISEQDGATDPLDEKILKAQQEGLPMSENSSPTKSNANMKSDDSEECSKMPPPPSNTTPSKANMKAPPSYSLKAPPSYSLKQSPDADIKKGASSSNSTKAGKVAYTFSGSQIVSSGQQCIKLRGLFYPPDESLDNFFLICSLVLDEEGTQDTPGASTAVSAAAATSRKCDQSDDDHSSAGNDGVDYQELIDLHEDAGMTTEELRKRYYMADDNDEEPSARTKHSKR